MAVSGSFDFNLSRNEIIEAAFRKIRVLRIGQTISSNLVTQGSQALNAMVKAWRAEGIHLWDIDRVTLPLHSSDTVLGTDGNDYECIRNHTSDSTTQPITGSKWKSYWQKLSTSSGSAWATGTAYVAINHYFLDTNIVDIENNVTVRENDNNVTDVTVQRLSRDEYWTLGAKTTEGKPTQSYFRRRPTPELFLFPYPDSATDYVIEFNAVRFSDDFDSAADTPDFLAEWLEALIYNLAEKLHSEYGTLKGQDFQDLKLQAREAKFIAKGMDEETGPVFFIPDMRRR